MQRPRIEREVQQGIGSHLEIHRLFGLLFNLGNVERRSAGRSSTMALIYQVFTQYLTPEALLVISVSIFTLLPADLWLCKVVVTISSPRHMWELSISNILTPLGTFLWRLVFSTLNIYLSSICTLCVCLSLNTFIKERVNISNSRKTSINGIPCSHQPAPAVINLDQSYSMEPLTATTVTPIPDFIYSVISSSMFLWKIRIK